MGITRRSPVREVWSAAAHLITGLLEKSNELVYGLLIFIEECGVPLPLPGDGIMLYAGYRVSRGRASLALTLLILEAATLAGASILYWLGRRGGRPLLYRYGRYLHINPMKLDQAAASLQRHGLLAIAAGRVLPGLRIATPLAAGVLELPYSKFLPAVFIGSTVYIVFWVVLGILFGPDVAVLLAGVDLSVRPVLTVLVVGGLAFFLIRAYRRGLSQRVAYQERGWETAALAGLLAMLEMGVAVNVALYAFAAAGLTMPQEALARALALGTGLIAGRGGGGSLLILALFILAGGIFWAEVYARLAVQLLIGPGLARGLAFSVVPFTASMLVLLPLLGAGVFGLGLGAGLLPVVAEGFRCAVFGVGLGTSYDILVDARAARGAPLPFGMQGVIA
jgi:membrane protein DedA with SNARE-associated domain